MIIQFQWDELNNLSTTPEGQLVLLFCLYINRANPLEKRISASPSLLQKKLNIKFIPTTLITSGLIIYGRNGLFSNYVCSEPQSYITSYSFIHAKTSAQEKINYVYMLSQRAMNNPNNWIPREYIDDKYLPNRFVYTTPTKIHFISEKQL